VAEQPDEFISVNEFDDLMEEDFARVISTPDTVLAPQFRGRKLFEKGLPTRLTLTREVATTAGYLMLDFTFQS
jgi:hypothetical protein